jgi:hypothetical protein
MKKESIALIAIFIIAISSLSMVLGQTHFEQITIEDGLPFDCINIKLVASENVTLQPFSARTHNMPYISDDCVYFLLIEGQTQECESCNDGPGTANFGAFVYLKNNETDFFGPFFPDCGGGENGSIYFRFPEKGFIPGVLLKNVEKIEVITGESDCPITYSWELYSICQCTGKQALYPKVDIEGFAVSGGATIIKDGKIVSAFNVVPGVQQTMIQVENRGFFTQKDARVRFIGLPEGVTVNVTPQTQTIKAHNIGTYSATFAVGPNVSSGTYDIAMVAYSPNGIFDTIRIKLVVP